MTHRPAADLAPLMPALLDALAYVGVSLVVIADRGDGLERWYANESAAALLGYTLEELEATSPIDTIVPEQRALMSQLSASFRAGQPVPPALEVAMRRKDGSALVAEAVIGVVPIDGGLAYMTLIRDVANQSQLSLLEADRIGLVGALAEGVAHEINNPLTSMMMIVHGLRKLFCAHFPDHVLRPAMRQLDDISAGAERIASNVKALQTIAKPRTGGPLDLASVVSASLRLVAPKLNTRAHVIRQIFPVPQVIGEESRIGQAVLAMMLFSSSGFDHETANTSNRIIVAVEERDGKVVVEVSDNGRDLPAEEARRAFDPFFRSSTRGAGVGVGLGVARSVATTLGGDVSLAPRPGGGAVITMRLPAARGSTS